MDSKLRENVRHESHKKESLSKRLFEEIIEPWIPIAWSVNDYGIDATVQIFRNIKGTNNFQDESKFFLVQLKSSSRAVNSKGNIQLQIPVHKIVKWYNSNVPVMLALCHLPTKSLYYKWIDTFLIKDLDIKKRYWEKKKTVGIKFNEQNKFSLSSKEDIVEYLLNDRYKKKSIVPPGTYFELHQASLDFVVNLEMITKSSNFRSISNKLRNVKKGIEDSIYSIAVTGPSRVGKSTLINRLLRSNKVDITPTGLFQTTGVPIQILPGHNEKVIVELKNGDCLEFPFTLEKIEEYGSQDKNPDNEKAVNQIHVEVCNKDLEKGVSIFDIPGLDDPCDEIALTSRRIIELSNAIIYVMDISRAATGGFLITKEDKKTILELGQKLDKIFLVLNKADALSEDLLTKIKDRVKSDLQKLKLNDSVGSKIFYVGMKSLPGTNSIEELREEIWSYLLNENKSGLARLLVTNRDLLKAVSEFQQLLNTSLLNNVQLDKLRSALDNVKVRMPEIGMKLKHEGSRLSKELTTHLAVRERKILFDLQTELNAILINDPLPSAQDIKDYLIEGVNNAIQDTYSEFQITINRISEEVYRWTEDHFKEVREIITADQEERVIDFEEINEFTMPQINLSSALSFGLLGAFVTSLINPGYTFLVGFASFFSNIIIGAEGRRQSRINKIMLDAQKRYNRTFEKVASAFIEIIRNQLKAMEAQVLESQNYFLEDLKSQMSLLGRELTQEERAKYKKLDTDLKNYTVKIKSHSRSISNYYEAII